MSEASPSDADIRRTKAVQRRETLGASDAPAALGLSPWVSPRGLYLEKLGLLPDSAPNLPMRVGLALEGLIAELYREATGNAILQEQPWIRGVGDYHFLSATLDGMTEAGYPVEFKTISERKGREIGDGGTDELPDHWLIQAHQQMFVSGADRVDFAVLIGNADFRLLRVERNDDLLDAMLPKLADFWGCVRRKEAPPESHPADDRLMHLIYPDAGPGIDLAFADQVAVDTWEMSRAVLKETKEGIDGARRHLLERLGNAAWGRLPDGRLLTRKIIDVKERTQVVKSYSYVDMRVKQAKDHDR